MFGELLPSLNYVTYIPGTCNEEPSGQKPIKSQTNNVTEKTYYVADLEQVFTH